MKLILVDAINCFVIKSQVIFENMHKLLEKYPNKKIIVTNANESQIKEFGLDKMPYEVFTLKHQPEKTDPDYFKKLLEHFKIKSNELIYFEHNPLAVESARKNGIITHHYDMNEKDLKALKEFLDKNL